jgi:prepilin-type N-terminal cleavage/methylation domain-containing protein
MNRKLKGFSLAELLISLLIISIVLSAAIPTLTKKSGANREFIWSWSTQNNNAYFGVGANQTAIIGYDKNPIMEEIDDYHLSVKPPLETILSDPENINNNALYSGDHEREITKANISNIPLNGNGDKLILLKKPVLARTIHNGEEQNEDESMFANSHITFYTLKNNTSTTDTTTSDIKYAGRITMDQGNIAMGIGSLQNQKLDKTNEDKLGENTALGHFALLRNYDGIRNTAVGKKTLSANEAGSYNTALGFGSLFKLGSVSLEGLTINSNEAYLDNTAVGVFSQMQNSIGKENTSIGAHSLKHLYYSKSDYTSESKPKYQALGNSNTAIGTGAMEFVLSGNENTAVGYNACSTISKGSNNICIGSYAGTGFDGKISLSKDNFGLYIGSSTDEGNLKEAPYLDRTEGTQKLKFSVPLISGHTRRTISYDAADGSEVNFHQELNVNAKQVVFRPFNAAFDAFKFESMIGKPASTTEELFKEGYGLLGSGGAAEAKWARASFNLRDTYDSQNNTEDGTSVQLQLSASGTGTYAAHNAHRMLFIDAYDPYLAGLYDSLAPVYINKMLKFEFPYRYNSSDYNTLSKRQYITSRISGVGLETLSNGSITEIAIPVVINDKLTVRNEDYEPSMLLKSGKFYLGTDNSNIQMITKGKDYDNEVNPTTINNANKSEIIITQKESSENKFEIRQETGTHRYFNVLQGTNTQNDPILQMQDKQFKVKNVDAIEMRGKGGTILLGSSYATEGKYDICYDTVCLKEVAQGLENLRHSVESYHSDIRLKNVSGDSTAGLKEINAIEVKNYTFKNDKEKTPHVGVIAQQLQKIFPDAVTKDKDGYLVIRTEDIFYAMVNSIKDLFKQLQDLTAKVIGLDSRITELEKQNKLLQEQNKLLKKQNKAIEKRLAKLERQAAK